MLKKNRKSQLLVNKVLARWMPETLEGAMAKAVRDLEGAIDEFDKNGEEKALLSNVNDNIRFLAPKKGKYTWQSLEESSATDIVKRLHKCRGMKPTAKKLLQTWTRDILSLIHI